jgi:nitrile hydratase accessory protein
LSLIWNMPESSSIDPEAARRAADAVPGIPRDASGPVFRAPWEAHAFAMALALYEKGLFAWSEWAAMLGEEIKKAQAAGDPDTGETYYHHWLATLERMVAEKRLSSAQALAQHYRAWERAMRRTPHGKPIELLAEDFHE